MQRAHLPFVEMCAKCGDWMGNMRGAASGKWNPVHCIRRARQMPGWLLLTYVLRNPDYMVAHQSGPERNGLLNTDEPE
jgi:hypothetical protein